jgi:DNA-binding MarR family transcriptional regulator
MSKQGRNSGATKNGILDELSSEGVIAFGHLLEGSQRLLTEVETDLKNSRDITVSEAEVLIRLANSTDNQLRPKELAEQCVMSTSGCTRLLDRLEKQNLVRRKPHGTDRRGLVVELTDGGRELLESVLPDHLNSLETRLWSVLTKTELKQLSTIMRKIRDANS